MKKLIPSPFDETNLSTEMIDFVLYRATLCEFSENGNRRTVYLGPYTFSMEVYDNKLKIELKRDALAEYEDFTEACETAQRFALHFVDDELLAINNVVADFGKRKDGLFIISYYYEIEEAE